MSGMCQRPCMWLTRAPGLGQEWEVYPEVVAALCAGRITWRADGVPIILAPEQGGMKP